MLLDFKTLSLMIVISSFLYAITIAFFNSQTNQYKGISLYMWGAVCAAIGFFATTLCSLFPENLVLRCGAGDFLILACYFYCLGIARFLEFDFNSRWLFGFLVLSMATINYIVVFHCINIVAILFVPIYDIIFYGIACYFLWQRRHANFSSSLYFMLFSLIFIILVFVVRCYVVIVYPATASYSCPMQSQSINNGFLLAIFISGYLRNVSFIMMVSQRLYQDLREAALCDFLTQIYNRRATQQFLDQQFNQFQRYKTACSLILLDIDHFKRVNDTHGHEAGDKILQMVAQTLKSQLRKTDILGRWGGEEFLCILPNTSLEEAKAVAEKLKIEIAETEAEGIACTISLGVKMLDHNDHTIDEAVKRADDALYKAKDSGRNCVVTFT